MKNLVQDQIKKIQAIAPTQSELVKSPRYLQNTVDYYLEILRSYQIELNDYYPFLINVVVLKLSDETMKEWEAILKNHKDNQQ